MGKKRSSSSTSTPSHSRSQNSANVKSMLKLDHVKNLSIWASGEALVPSLGAFFGHRFAATAEALGVPPDPSLFTCQRCESILHPGYNCTVRTEKSKAKFKRRRKKHGFATQNNVVYSCHFCSHHNRMRGTPKGYMKELCPPKAKLPSKSDLTQRTPLESSKPKVTAASKDDPLSKKCEIASQEISSTEPVTNSPTTPSTKVVTLLDLEKRKRSRSRTKKAGEFGNNSVAKNGEESIAASRKRKKKSWTSLKDIVEHSEHDNNRNLANLTIPFLN